MLQHLQATRQPTVASLFSELRPVTTNMNRVLFRFELSLGELF